MAFLGENKRSKFSEYITRMIMNLFGHEKSVITSDRLFQFAHLKFSSYKEGTKTLESTLGSLTGLICRIKTCSGKTSLDFSKMQLYERFI